MPKQAGRRRLKAGDLLELRLPDGFAYLQFVGKHIEYGDAVWVITQQAAQAIVEFSESSADDGYLAFYPATASVNQGLTKLVGSRPLPRDVAVPTRLRRAGARSRAGSVLTWIIEGGGQDKLVRTLDEQEKCLPIAAIWNHEFLVTRIVERWRPIQES